MISDDVFDEIASNVQVIVPVGSEAAYKTDENWKELFKETTEISSIEAAKGNAKVKKLFRNGKICIGDYTIAGLRVL